MTTETTTQTDSSNPRPSLSQRFYANICGLLLFGAMGWIAYDEFLLREYRLHLLAAQAREQSFVNRCAPAPGQQK